MSPLRKSTGRLIGGIVALALLVTCSTVPDTGRKRLIFSDPKQEMQMGLSAFQKLKGTRPISRNRHMNAMLQRVASRLTGVIPLEGARWEFLVFDDKTPNAFALPGGKVGVHSSMFQVAQSEAQLAAVVGHEIGHVVARHGGERASHGALAQLGGAVVGAATKGTDYAQRAAQIYGLGAKYGAILPFSRKHELEADQLGALYMARAGYDPREAITFWERFASYKKQRGGAGPPEFLSTHPLDARRIQALKDYMPRALSEFRPAGGAPAARALGAGASAPVILPGPLSG